MTASDHLGIHVPFLDYLGVQVEKNARGNVEVALDLRPELMNNHGATHGGVIMTLLDVCMAIAARTSVDNQYSVMTVDMSLTFLRPAPGRVVAEGRVLRGGRSLFFCEGEARDENGELVAKSLGTFKLRRVMKEGEGN